MKQLTWIPLLLVSLATCLAQDYGSRGEIFGSVAQSSLGGDEGTITTGANYGMGFGVRPFSRIAFELEVSGGRYTKGNEFAMERAEWSPIYWTANAVYHFSTARWQPYVLLGAGVLRDAGKAELSFPEPRLFQYSRTDLALAFGAGLKIFLTERISLRPEFRHLDSRRRTMVDRFSMGVGFHW